MNNGANPPAAVANKAALIATFYYVRHPARERDFREPLETHLTQELEPNQPSGNPKVWLEGFNPPEKSAHDISVLQLAMNASDQSQSANTAWVELAHDLSQLLSDEGLFVGLIGYSLIYQAVLKPGMAPLFDNLLPDNANRRKLLLEKPSVGIIKPLATSDTSYGRLWLLDIPLQKEGRQASAIYVAVCAESGNDDFVAQVLWGESASWLLPDLIAHKSYHQIRQYRGIADAQVSFSATLQQVRKTTLDLLSDRSEQKGADEFSQLSTRSQALIGDMAKLGALRITLAKQEYNYSQWLDEAQIGDIITFHATRIKANLKELELNLAEAETVLKATDTALNIMQTRLDKVQESRQFRLSIILTLLGTALAVPQVIDREVTNAIWAWWDGQLMNEIELYLTLQLFGVQLLCITMIGGVVALLVFIFYRMIRAR